MVQTKCLLAKSFTKITVFVKIKTIVIHLKKQMLNTNKSKNKEEISYKKLHPINPLKFSKQRKSIDQPYKMTIAKPKKKLKLSNENLPS
jgi:hypothetical protein